MQGIIFGKTGDRALAEANKICEDYNMMLIPYISKSKDRIIFENGDVWDIVSGEHCGRGMKANVAMIDIQLDQQYIDTVIIPCICTLPYGAYNFFSCREDLTN